MARDDKLLLTLNYAGQLGAEAGIYLETFRTETGTLLIDVLREAASRHSVKFQQLLFDEEGALRRTLIVAMDDLQVSEPGTQVLNGNHDIFLMTPIAGG